MLVKDHVIKDFTNSDSTETDTLKKNIIKIFPYLQVCEKPHEL